MATQSFEVQYYKVNLVSLNSSALPGIHASVELYGANKKRATLWFHSEPTTLPNSASGSGDDIRYYGRFSAAQFADSVDLLRNEKPVVFEWNDASKTVRLSTWNEPVGEETDMGY